MAYQKLQPGRSRTYFPSTFSDTVDNVALTNNIILGVTSPSGTPGVLTSSSATTFIQDKVQPGDLVLNATVSSRGQSTLVKQVISDTELILQDADAIFFPSNFFFITPPPSEPAVLNVQQTTAGGISLKITTSGGDDLTFVGLQSGSYLPVQTTRIWETVGDNIIENGSFRSGSNLIQNGSFNEIGPELVTNGSFREVGTNVVDCGDFSCAVPTDYWTLGTGWSVGDNKASCDGSTGNLIQSITGSANKSFKLVFTISDFVSGIVIPTFVGITGTSYNADGTYTEYIQSGSDVRFVFYSTSFDGSITNVSVQEVGQDWTVVDGAGGDTVTFGDSFAEITKTSVNPSVYLSQDYAVTLGASHKLTYTVVENTFTGGLTELGLSGAGAYGSAVLDATASATPKTVYLTVTDDTPSIAALRFYSQGVGGSIKITNISVKKIAPYWTVTNSDSTHYVNFPTGYAQLIAATDSPQVQLEQNVLDATGLKSYEINCNIDYGQGSNLILNGDFSATGADLVLDGDFPLPNVNWIIAASTTINGGSATFGGLGAVTEAEMLLASFVVRVEADGGVVEAQTCLASDLTFLTENP